MSSSQVPTEYRRVLSHSTPVTVGLVIVILGGVIANITYMHQLEEKMDTRYVTKEMFDVRMNALTAQYADLKSDVADLKAEIRRQGIK